MQLTPEDKSVDRSDIQGYVDDGMGPEEIEWTLTQKGVKPDTIKRILGDLNSYN